MSTAPALLTLTEGVTVPLPEEGEEVRFDEGAAQIVIDFIGLLPFGQNEWAGKPFVLLPWETSAIRQFYGVVAYDVQEDIWLRYRQYLYIEISKKNGKSELAAALGLYHLLADGEALPNVGIFTADKDNAAIIYNAAKYMVEHSCLGRPEHDPIAWAVDSRREIRTKYGGVMKVYSSDAKTKHGYSFSAVIFDELHAQPDRRLWDVVTTGSGDARRQPVYIVLTTAGDDPDRSSIGWEIHEKCRRLLNWRAGSPESETDRDDPSWCPIMYGVSVLTRDDPDAIAALDIYDPTLWKACNPSLGITVKLRTVRQHARSARQSEAEERLFRWLRLNQWVSTKTVGWIPLTIYDKTQWNGDAEELRGKRCYGGLDLSSTTDLTAFALLFPRQEGLETAVTLWWAWVPDSDIEARERRDHAPYRDWERAHFLRLCEGDLIDYPDVEAVILEAAETYELELLGLDPYLSRTISASLAARLKEKRLKTELAEIPQTMLGMSPAMVWMKEAMYARTLLHQHNTCARYCFGNVRCAVDGNGNTKPMKNRSRGRIDVTVAWIIAAAAMLAAVANKKPDVADTIRQGGFRF